MAVTKATPVLKQPSQLPQLQPNAQNSTISLSPDAMMGRAQPGYQPFGAGPMPTSSVPTPQALSEQARSMAATPSTTQGLQQATTKATEQFVKNPMGDYDPTKVKQAGLEKANADWASGFEGLRQQFGSQSGSGLLQKEMLGNVLQHNVDQAKLGADYDQANFDRYLNAVTQSINAGNQTALSAEDILGKRLSSMATAKGMGEPEAQRAFQAEQAGLDRAQQILVQSNDITGQKDLRELQAKLDKGQLLLQQDFEGAQSALDRAQQLAIQSNDVQAQKDISTLRSKLDIEANAASQKLQAALDEARAKNDLGRQKELLGIQLDGEIKKMQQTFTQEQIIANLKVTADKALKNMDIAAAQAAQQKQLELDWQKAANEKEIATMELQLKEKGFDFEQYKNQYNTMLNMVQQGFASPESLNQFVNGVAVKSGVKIKPPDPAAVKNEINKQYEMMRYQFQLTNPNATEQQFNDWFNKTVYYPPEAEGTGGAGDPTYSDTWYNKLSIPTPVGGIKVGEAGNAIADLWRSIFG